MPRFSLTFTIDERLLVLSDDAFAMTVSLDGCETVDVERGDELARYRGEASGLTTVTYDTTPEIRHGSFAAMVERYRQELAGRLDVSDVTDDVCC